MATVQQLEEGVKRAYEAGNMDYARTLGAMLVKARQDKSNLIPDAQVEGTGSAVREPTLAERLAGAGEAVLTGVTAGSAGTLGMLGGTAKGITQELLSGQFGTPEALRRVEQAAAQGAEAFTYAPRTQQGQDLAQTIGEIAAPLAPAAGLLGELSAIGRGAQVATPAITTTAARAAAPVAAAGERLRTATQGLRIPGLGGAAEGAPSTGGRGSIGAAATPLELMRTEKAEALPVPVKLTEGAARREADQLAFEKEQMKGQFGAPLRARAEENNLQALQNFDALIDMTAAEAPDFAAAGNSVVKALSEGYKSAKNETNIAYRNAKLSGESQAPVDPNTVVQLGEGESAISNSLIGYLNSKIQGVPSAAVPDAARKLMVKMGLAKEGPDGDLIGLPATVGKMEDFRKELSGTAKFDDRVGLREETILKKIIDAQTEPVAGPLYKHARLLRTQQARKYENRAIVARLLTNRKNMDDPQVAVDQVFNRSIVNGSPEEITFLKRVLNTSGEDGKQAWKELQGSLTRYIRDEATKGMGMDSADNPIVSPAKLHQTVSALDKNGRLDIVLGKKNAEIVRDLNEVVRYVNTVPPGTLVNTSGTAGTLMAAMAEAGATGALTGLPVPVVSLLRAAVKNIRDRKLKARIERALRKQPQNPQP